MLDYDDATYHYYDLNPSRIVRVLLGRRIDRLIEGARLVVTGNVVLAQRAAAAGAKWVEIIPSVVDLEKYPVIPEQSEIPALPKIVWIGSPTTVRYLDLIRGALVRLSKKYKYELVVIGGTDYLVAGVKTTIIKWSESTEAGNLAACDIGVMPLEDSPWERGKCGYKLIQYMAAGLPVVASPVGANSDIVQHGQGGFLADSEDSWVDALSRLLDDQNMRIQMAARGRRRVENHYCLQATAPKMTTLIREAAKC